MQLSCGTDDVEGLNDIVVGSGEKDMGSEGDSDDVGGATDGDFGVVACAVGMDPIACGSAGLESPRQTPE